MSNSQIVYTGKSVKGDNLLIRYPTLMDIEKMWEYINTLSKERTFVRFQGEQISLVEEKKYLDTYLRKIEKRSAVKLLVFANEKLVGLADISMQEMVEKHVGVLGISIAKEYRRRGIGSLLLKHTIEEAVKTIPSLEIITLCIFSENKIAHTLYKNLGFIEYGRLPSGIKLEHAYNDRIYMFKTV